MDRGKFEDQWKEAFSQAEVSPSSDSWINIELELERAEGQRMKRRLLFYKTLAAASVVFAMAIGGGTGLYINQQRSIITSSNNQLLSHNNNTQNETSLQDQSLKTIAPESITTKDETLQQKAETTTSDSAPRERTNSGNVQGKSSTTEIADDQRIAFAEGLQKDQEKAEKKRTGNTSVNVATPTTPVTGKQLPAEHARQFYEDNNLIGYAEIPMSGSASDEEVPLALSLDPKRLPALYQNKNIALQLPKQAEADPVAVMLAQLAAREKEITEEEIEKPSSLKDEKLWTSVGVSAGSFNTIASNVSPTSSNTFIANNASLADSEIKASGVAYAVGVNMGTRIANRWVLQGGVNYLTQSSDYTANAAVRSPDYQTFRPASINELEQLNQDDARIATSEKLVTTAPYNVNNSVRYISLPVQAGYLLVNSKFGVQLNAGISTDLFIQNVKTAEGQSIKNVDQGRGDAPYRPMNFSGLMGTELSYKFNRHYRIAVNPGLRYPFRSIYKSELGLESSPLTFDVGLRFRYIFH